MTELPPGIQLYQLGTGHYVSRAMYLAAKLDLAGHIARGARDFRALAKATETDAPSLNRVLRLLAAVGIFEERENGEFALTPLGDILRDEAPGSMRASVMLFTGPGIQEDWAELEHCVRTGEPAYRKLRPDDADAFSSIARDPARAAIFDKAMATFAPQTSAAIAAGYEFGQFGKLADVGGGNGALMIGILRANSALRGLVFDRPDVIERARAHVASAGFADRCELVAGSFFEKVPSGADAYLLKHVIHDWNDEKARAILRAVRAVVPPHGKLLIVEGVYPARIERTLEGRGAAANDVNMLVCTGGRQRSEAEFRELYAASGFRLTAIAPTPARVSVIEGVPA
jgi:SAM-dependent methyltransferase